MNRANNFPAPAVQEETWMRKAASKIDLLDPGRVKPLDEIDPTTGHIPDECVQGRMVGHSVYNCPACLVERCESCGEWPWNGCDHNRIRSDKCEHVAPCESTLPAPPAESQGERTEGMNTEWIEVTTALPKNGEVVDTKIDDSQYGCAHDERTAYSGMDGGGK